MRPFLEVWWFTLQTRPSICLYCPKWMPSTKCSLNLSKLLKAGSVINKRYFPIIFVLLDPLCSYLFSCVRLCSAPFSSNWDNFVPGKIKMNFLKRAPLSLRSVRAYASAKTDISASVIAIESPSFGKPQSSTVASLSLALPCGSMYEQVAERGLSSILKSLQFKVLVSIL